MASFWSRDVTHRSVELCVLGLDGVVADYDKFVYTIEQNNITVYEYTLYPEDIEDADLTGGIYISFDNPDYLGYNILSPGCEYTAYLDCYKDDELYAIYDTDFTTEEINPPSVSKITPDVYVAVRDQGDYETCVADSLACAMDIFKARETEVYYENFSTAYIYGTDGDDEEGMYNEEAINNCCKYGSPRWEIASGIFPDSMLENEAAELFTALKTDTVIYNHAKNQKFKQKASSCNVDFYDCDGVADAIETNGYFMFNFRIPENFYNVDDSGIIPQPDEYSGKNHSMALIGLTTINGKKYWIAQNSWGESWGDNGYCYLPYDWGCGVQSPLYKTDSGKESQEFGRPSSWTTDCYAPSPDSGYIDDNPNEVYNIRAELPEGTFKQVRLSWESDTPDCKYFVLARQSGTEAWYIKAVTSDTFVDVFVDKYTLYEFMIISNNISYYCSPQSEIVEVEIVDADTPRRWQWTSPMDEDLEVVMSNTLGCPVVRPITAIEWYKFQQRINEILSYQGRDEYDFYFIPGGLSTDEEADITEFDPDIYNEAVRAIRTLDWITEDELPYINYDTQLSSEIFIRIRDVLNGCI